MWGILAGAVVLGIVGFLDDKFEEKISPYWRLAANVLAALVIIGTGVGIAYITNPFGGVLDLSWPRWCLGTHCIWVLADIFAFDVARWNAKYRGLEQWGRRTDAGICSDSCGDNCVFGMEV